MGAERGQKSAEDKDGWELEGLDGTFFPRQWRQGMGAGHIFASISLQIDFGT